MFYLPIFGAFLEAVDIIITKKVLKKKISSIDYILYIFLCIVLVSLPFLFFFWRIDKEALELKNLAIFIIIVIVSIFANFLVIYSLRKKDVSEIEPIRLTTPLFTVLLVFIFGFFFEVYSTERNYLILALTLVASLTLILTHIKKGHLDFNKYIIAALAGSFLFALEIVISKPILLYYNPLTFYFLRSLLIFIMCWIFFHPKISNVEIKTRAMILVSAIIAVIYRVILYNGIINLGVIFTTILFILAPVFIYIFAAIFLKEKITLKQIISSIIIVLCVVIAILNWK